MLHLEISVHTHTVSLGGSTEKGVVKPGRKQLIYTPCYSKGEFVGDEEKINEDENTNHHIGLPEKEEV